MRKRNFLVVVLAALLLVGGLILAGCRLGGCSNYSRCTNYQYLDCGMSGCYSRSHVSYVCDC